MTNLLRDLPLRKIGHLCEPQTLLMSTAPITAEIRNAEILDSPWLNRAPR
jgi:hypothetical protein